MADQELQLGEFLASGQWISFPGFSGSSAKNFVFIFTTRAAATTFGKKFTGVTIVIPGGKVKISSHKVKERDGIFELTLSTGPDDSGLKAEIVRLFDAAVYDGYSTGWFRSKMVEPHAEDKIRQVLLDLEVEGRVESSASGGYFYWKAKRR